MKKEKKNLGNIIVDFVREAFFGGNEYETVKTEEKTPFPFAVVGGVLVTTALFLMLVFSLIKASELSTDIASMKKELVSVSAKADNLEGEFSRKYPFTEIQKYAEENGFVANGGREVILPDEPTETGNAKSTESSSSLMNIFTSILQKIKDLFR